MKPRLRKTRRLFVGTAVGGILLLVAASTVAGVAVAGDQNAESASATAADANAKDGKLETSVDNPEQVAREHDAKYTKREIEAAATRVANYSSDQFEVVTVTVEDLYRPTPVYGIEVEVADSGDLSYAAIEAELSELAGLPVSVNQDLHSVPAVGILP